MLAQSKSKGTLSLSKISPNDILSNFPFKHANESILKAKSPF